MPTLDPTVGGASANTYASLAEANLYCTNRPNHSDFWDTATDTQKEEALIWGTILLDMAFQWTGGAANGPTPGPIQALAWPRIGMTDKNFFPIDPTAIPAFIKNAQSEYARQLLAQDIASDNDAVKNEVLGLKAGSVSMQFRNTELGTLPQAQDAAVRRKGPSLNYLAKWVPDAVRLQIPMSCYVQNLVSNPMVFIAR